MSKDAKPKAKAQGRRGDARSGVGDPAGAGLGEKEPILSRLSPPEGAVRGRRRKGRGLGSGLGKTGGHGMKGQKARSPGNFSKLGFEGGQTPLYRRLPKRGFLNPFTKDVAVINVKDLQRFAAGSTVDEPALRDAGLLKRKVDRIKVLGEGELDRALTVKLHAFSGSAKDKIEKAGGTVELVEIPLGKGRRGDARSGVGDPGGAGLGNKKGRIKSK